MATRRCVGFGGMAEVGATRKGALFLRACFDVTVLCGTLDCPGSDVQKRLSPHSWHPLVWPPPQWSRTRSSPVGPIRVWKWLLDQGLMGRGFDSKSLLYVFRHDVLPLFSPTIVLLHVYFPPFSPRLNFLQDNSVPNLCLDHRANGPPST